MNYKKMFEELNQKIVGPDYQINRIEDLERYVRGTKLLVRKLLIGTALGLLVLLGLIIL